MPSAPPLPTPSQTLLSQLLGVWSLTTYTLLPSLPTSTSPSIFPLGPSPHGLLIYHPSGYMSAQVLEPGQPPYSSPVLALATNAERAESTRRYLAYTGKFSILENGKGEWGRVVVVHDCEISLFPNWVGGVQRRSVRVEEGGERLVLRTEEPFEAWVGFLSFSYYAFCDSLLRSRD